GGVASPTMMFSGSGDNSARRAIRLIFAKPGAKSPSAPASAYARARLIASDAIALVDGLAKSPICRKAVFQVATDGPRVDRKAARHADRFCRVAIAAFQVDRDGQVGRV